MCQHCRKRKLHKVLHWSCGCGFTRLCGKCRMPEDHGCPLARQRAPVELKRVVAPKVAVI